MFHTSDLRKKISERDDGKAISLGFCLPCQHGNHLDDLI